MTEESLSIRIGYNPLTMKFFFNGTLVIFSIIILLYISQFYSLIPILFTIGCLMAEVRWFMRKPMALNLVGETSGISYGNENISWKEFHSYSKWGPIGIPFTPLRYKGIYLHRANTKSINLNSTYKGFEEVSEMVEKKKIPLSTSTWYQYPKVTLRFLRYLTATVFCTAYSLFMSFLLLIIPVVYFIYRRKKVNDKKENIAEDTWISIFVGAIMLIPAIVLLSYPFIAFLFCFIPVFTILWFPWQPKPLCLHNDTLFVGKKKAYPLRHLRTTKSISKFFFLRYQRLNFANGDVDIYPYLINNQLFKDALEENWSSVQQKYQGKSFSAEEAEILTPQEEAKRSIAPTAKEVSISDINENDGLSLQQKDQVEKENDEV
ncbi:hypothetical protein [Candidatus Uabimicrobium sp. HlEnr_7]|uniref:hypothetical protein n=1 Tax=Candidatus Uabimicrobium helgolandensis TaxID=3095367 RepID=UPI00355897F7